MTININISPSQSEEVASQWLFTPTDLLSTPTVLSSLLKPDEERRNRRKGIALIYKVAEKLNMYTATHLVSTAALFFHRFFMRRLMRPVGCGSVHQGQPTFAYQDIALAALYLATKVEECYKRLDDLVAVGLELDSRIDQGAGAGSSSAGGAATGQSADRESEESILRQNILWGEERLLETLAFDLIIDHPQKHLIIAARALGVDRGLTRIAYAHIHDAFRDPVCTFYEPPVLAAGAFALACQDVDIDPNDFKREDGTGWLEAFDVSREEVDDCSTALREVRDNMLLTEPRTILKPPTSSTVNSATSTPHPHRQPSQSRAVLPGATSSPIVAAAGTHTQHPSASSSRVATPQNAMPPPASSNRMTSNAAAAAEEHRPPSRHGKESDNTSAIRYPSRPFSTTSADSGSYTLKSPPGHPTATAAASSSSSAYTPKSPARSYTLKSPDMSMSASTSTGFTLQSPKMNPPVVDDNTPKQEEIAQKVDLEQKQSERKVSSGGENHQQQQEEEEEGEIWD